MVLANPSHVCEETWDGQRRFLFAAASCKPKNADDQFFKRLKLLVIYKVFLCVYRN